jgi:hypothetical protein
LDQTEANNYNATLAGALNSGTALSSSNADAYNAKLPGVVKAGDETGFVGYIMLPRPEVSKVDNFKYQLVVKLEYTGGSNMVAIDMDPPTGGFEEGKIYNVIVSVQSPEQIFATAVLQEWETYEDADHHPYIEYGND